ncbi:FtsX-like permease family protein [Lusitaniella coriacea LEGE 07157]|uniref:FtsX-like permease family protein n=1 Tax=Lusitaniella coriacea LEGE 07157 TaxID=945747 RepID=A0A8J7AZL9_9CYAN|nr:ABC transporter permease DevC [Lusitaniella coriacea]MBE9114285.1 FtsX-like permease family protein [Lusitaniella coriacea LEGE 07157]
MFQKIPIAWLQLQYQKGQTIAAILGIAFTALLLFMQIGFRSSFLASLVQLPSSFQSDIFLMSASSVTSLRPVTFSERRLYQVLAFKEVESIAPIYLTQVLLKNPTNKSLFLRQVQVIAFPLKSQVIDLPGIEENLHKLKIDNVFLLDKKSRPEFLPLISEVNEKGKTIVEITTVGLAREKIEIAGLFELGASTSSNSALVTSDANFLRTFNRQRGEIGIGLIELKPEADLQQVLSKMEKYFNEDVKVVLKTDLIKQEKEFYEYNTPMGLIFRFGLIGSIVVGAIILYQILYQKISKFIKEYATLKALGYTHNSLVKIVLEESLMLAILGYIPGFILSCLMYDILAKATSLQFVMTIDVAIAVLLLICSICFISGVVAVRKLKEADPADVF